MAKQARIKFNLTAYRQIRRSAPVERMLGGKARQIANACGGDDAGYYTQSSIGATRARAVVIAGSGESIRDNATNNTLVKALDRGRG